jgi:hypothetical protein
VTPQKLINSSNIQNVQINSCAIRNVQPACDKEYKFAPHQYFTQIVQKFHMSLTFSATKNLSLKDDLGE